MEEDGQFKAQLHRGLSTKPHHLMQLSPRLQLRKTEEGREIQ